MTGKFLKIMSRSHAGSLLTGFAHGLAQMGSIGTARPVARFPKAGTAEAIKGDWQRVGGDMNRGLEKVRAREKAKA